MRTTLAIDDATYARLQDEMKKRGISFREIVNLSLSRGLDDLLRPATRTPFRVKPFATGPRPGISFDCVGKLLDEVEGPDWK